jgi:hypothetical protein
LVEQSIRNRQVIGSSPIVGSILTIIHRDLPHIPKRLSPESDTWQELNNIELCIYCKRKGHPATGQPFLQGRIVPTEAKIPSKLFWRKSYEPKKQGVKDFSGK